MEGKVLEKKIDFVVVVEVSDANPNGDPLAGNRPRTTYDGLGEISDVCIKRKIRNRFMDMGLPVFVQTDSKKLDSYKSLQERYTAMAPKRKEGQEDLMYQEACERWVDVRAFGSLLAFKGSSLSLGVTGAVSINQAKSVAPIDIYSMQITKSVNSVTKEGGGKSEDTMGMKSLVSHGVYIIKGSISAVQAQKNGFTEEDAENLKEALRTLFYNDASAARPDGSMRVVKLYWFTHPGNAGSAYKTHNSVKISLKDGVQSPTSIEDYNIEYTAVDGVDCEIIEGE